MVICFQKVVFLFYMSSNFPIVTYSVIFWQGSVIVFGKKVAIEVVGRIAEPVRRRIVST